MKRLLALCSILFLIAGCGLQGTDNLQDLMKAAEQTSAQVTTRGFVELTGGSSSNALPLDGKSVSGLKDGTRAIGWDGDVFRTYRYTAAETASQSVPQYIIPYDNATGTGTWVLHVGHLEGITGHTPQVLNYIAINIVNGSNASTVSCTVIALYNGTSISQVDNIGKGDISGDFELESDGTFLYILSTGFPGNLVRTMTFSSQSGNGDDIQLFFGSGGGNIAIYATEAGDDNTFLDFTTLVDTGRLRGQLLFITDE
jgi:hypothetical protein